MGENAESHLNLAGLQTRSAETPENVGAMATATLEQAFAGEGMAALLLHQSLMPVNTFDSGY